MDGVGSPVLKKLQALDQADVYPDLRCWKMEGPWEPGASGRRKGPIALHPTRLFLFQP